MYLQLLCFCLLSGIPAIEKLEEGNASSGACYGKANTLLQRACAGHQNARLEM